MVAIMSNPTRLQAQLQAALASSQAAGDAGMAQFWFAWQADGGAPIDTLADFQATCDPQDGPVALMDRVFSVLTGTAGKPLAKGLGKSGRDFVFSLLLAAAEQYLHGSGNRMADGAHSDFTVRVKDPLTASLLATVHYGCGLRLVPGNRVGEPAALNLLRDAPALALTQGDALLEAWGAELVAWCDSVRNNAEDWLDQGLTHRAATAMGPVSPAAVSLALGRIDRQFGIRPMIAVTVGQGGLLASQPQARSQLAGAFGGVGVFLHDSAGPLASATLEADLLRFVAGVFAAFDADPSRPPQPRPRRKVFISYAHVDGADWLALVQRHLAGLDDIEVWSDKRLETGDNWFAEIQSALEASSCAVLILTPGFLGSAFIKRDEIPKLLGRLETAPNQLKLLPILAEDCDVEAHLWLNALQVQCKSKPLEKQGDELNTELKKLSVQIRTALGNPG